jgi:hypothetical protein
MYECIVVNDHGRLRLESRSFFSHADWPISGILDPEDSDPARYAILAAIVKLMVEDFNKIIELGMPRGSPPILTDEERDELRARPPVREELPRWVANVPKPSEPVIIPTNDGATPDEKHRNPLFSEMNIVLLELPPMLG